jgi:MraZ protein
MTLLTGEFRNTLDEKGRISLPARLRAGLAGNSFVLTRGVDACLWLFQESVWDTLVEGISAVGSPFDSNSRLVQRRMVAPAQEVEIDKLGRISIPQTLRNYAQLGRDCTILGMANYVEIWDSAAYALYLGETEPDFLRAAESFKSVVLGAKRP